MVWLGQEYARMFLLPLAEYLAHLSLCSMISRMAVDTALWSVGSTIMPFCTQTVRCLLCFQHDTGACWLALVKTSRSRASLVPEGVYWTTVPRSHNRRCCARQPERARQLLKQPGLETPPYCSVKHGKSLWQVSHLERLDDVYRTDVLRCHDRRAVHRGLDERQAEGLLQRDVDKDACCALCQVVDVADVPLQRSVVVSLS